MGILWLFFLGLGWWDLCFVIIGDWYEGKGGNGRVDYWEDEEGLRLVRIYNGFGFGRGVFSVVIKCEFEVF